MSHDARFIGGPVDGTVRTWMGDLPEVVFMFDSGAPQGWIVVGHGSLEPDPPWPGQVTYRRDKDGNFRFDEED